MAFTYGFYNSLNDDRLYNAKQVSELFDGIIRDGVFSSVDEIFATVPGEGLQVIVKTGRAWFNHTWNKNDSAYPLNFDPAHVTLSRRDAVVLEVNEDVTARRNRLLIVKGTAATTPAKPTLTNTLTIHQHVLAYVTIPPAATAITAGMIDIRVGTSDCPFVTGILQTANIDDLFQQWEHNFDTWLSGIKVALSGDIVTNLLYLIDRLTTDKVDKEAVASVAEAKALGVQDKWMTPYTTGLVIDPLKYVDEYAWLYCPPSNTVTYTQRLISSGNTTLAIPISNLQAGSATTTYMTETLRHIDILYSNYNAPIYTATGRSVNQTTGAVTITGAATIYPTIAYRRVETFNVGMHEGVPVAGWGVYSTSYTLVGGPGSTPLKNLYWSRNSADLTNSSASVWFGGTISVPSNGTGISVSSIDEYKVSSVSAGAPPTIYYSSSSTAYPNNTGGYFSLGKTKNAISHLTPMVYGSYTGDGAATRDINLGFSPRMVILTSGGQMNAYSGGIAYRGAAVKNSGNTVLELTDTGFRVFTMSSYVMSNASNGAYNYVAWR